jgi:hypothetical protein
MMANGNGIKAYSLDCGGAKYLLVAAAVRLPKALFLGRLVIQASKPAPRAAKGASSLRRASAPARRRSAGRGKKK